MPSFFFLPRLAARPDALTPERSDTAGRGGGTDRADASEPRSGTAGPHRQDRCRGAFFLRTGPRFGRRRGRRRGRRTEVARRGMQAATARTIRHLRARTVPSSPARSSAVEGGREGGAVTVSMMPLLRLKFGLLLECRRRVPRGASAEAASARISGGMHGSGEGGGWFVGRPCVPCRPRRIPRAVPCIVRGRK